MPSVRAYSPFAMFAFTAGCQDFALNVADTMGGDTSPAVAATRAPTIFHVVVRDDLYAGLWTNGSIDRSKSCVVEGEDGEDYRACCPTGFTPFGFWMAAEGIGEQPWAVNCVEDEPRGARAVLYVGGGFSSNDLDQITENWTGPGETPAGWAPGGTWKDGRYTYASCARDVRDDQLPLFEGSTANPNPPDDYTACCPSGYSAVGQGKMLEYVDVVCLQDAPG